MRIRLLSDLHLEFADWTPPAVAADVVVLAGDIHTRGRGVAWAARHFDGPVIYVPGNHEYYGTSIHHGLEVLRRQARGTQVHVLDTDAVTIDGVRFLGATLWTDYRLTGNLDTAAADAWIGMNDYRRIRNDTFGRLRPAHLANRHAQARAWLEAKLGRGSARETVVISHHAPSRQSISPERLAEEGHLASAYASDLEALMGDERVALWVHGHVHQTSDYGVAGTRVVCNPRGYCPDGLNPGFVPDLVIEL